MASHCCRLISECYWNAKAPGTRIDKGEKERKRKRPARKAVETTIKASGHRERRTCEVFCLSHRHGANRWNQETDYVRHVKGARPDADRYTNAGAPPAPLASTAPLIDS